jgi:ubiquitin-protein ligase E3 A
MFKYFPSSHLLWFNSDSFESDVEFELIGILLGIAIYNSIIVDFRMPKVSLSSLYSL